MKEEPPLPPSNPLLVLIEADDDDKDEERREEGEDELPKPNTERWLRNCQVSDCEKSCDGEDVADEDDEDGAVEDSAEERWRGDDGDEKEVVEEEREEEEEEQLSIPFTDFTRSVAPLIGWTVKEDGEDDTDDARSCKTQRPIISDL